MPSLFGAPPSAAPESPPPEGKQGLGLWGESEFARPPPSSPPPPSGFGLFGPSDFGISDSDTQRKMKETLEEAREYRKQVDDGEGYFGAVRGAQTDAIKGLFGMGAPPPPPKQRRAGSDVATQAPAASALRACTADDVGCVQAGPQANAPIDARGLMIPFRYEKDPGRGARAKTAAAAAAELRRVLERQDAKEVKVSKDGDAAATVRARFAAGPLGFVNDEVEFLLRGGVASFRAASTSGSGNAPIDRNRNRLVKVRKALSYGGWACACAADADLVDQAKCALFCEP